MNNSNDQKRHDILGIKELTTKAGGGIAYFKDKSLKTILTLVNDGFLDLNEEMNNMPPLISIVKVAQELGNDSVSFHGYIVGEHRKDSRITIDSITFLKNSEITVSEESKVLLAEWVKSADEVSKSALEVTLWWD